MNMKKLLLVLSLPMAFCFLSACSPADSSPWSQASQPVLPEPGDDENGDNNGSDDETDEDIMESNVIRITAGSNSFTATLAANSSAEALKQRLADGPVTISMSDYGDMEKVGPLGFTLPRNDEYMTTAPGDIVLYLGNTLTFYYDVNSWSLTRLGRVDGVSTRDEMLGLLGGKGDVEVTLSLE